MEHPYVNVPWQLRLIAWLRRMPIVALTDHDGTAHARLARTDMHGRLWAKRFGFGIRDVWLIDDGTIQPRCYVKGWQMVRDYRQARGSDAHQVTQ